LERGLLFISLRYPKFYLKATITRTFDEAMDLINGYRKRIVDGEVDLTTLAEKESDCSSAKRGGDLNTFSKGLFSF
jgi:peptidyl-prolyl cis-trans isomerase NIMA-interacting 1